MPTYLLAEKTPALDTPLESLQWIPPPGQASHMECTRHHSDNMSTLSPLWSWVHHNRMPYDADMLKVTGTQYSSWQQLQKRTSITVKGLVWTDHKTTTHLRVTAYCYEVQCIMAIKTGKYAYMKKLLRFCLVFTLFDCSSFTGRPALKRISCPNKKFSRIDRFLCSKWLLRAWHH